MYNKLKRFFLYYWYRLRWALDRYIVITCAVCRRPMWQKNVKWEYTTYGRIVPMCKQCSKDLHSV